MIDNNNQLVAALIEKGVKIPNPSSVEIGEEVDINMISSENVVIYSGCKIYGKKTLILSGATLGSRSPVTIKNCQLGKNVDLKGGYFEESTFLDSANMGDGAEVREGCLLEEEANGAHTVGLKQTILFPFVTLGSIINFCDILMAGGTSRADHSEVGSSYIHFNYTPNQDKATASLIGDVARGVMLDQPPIFLGGQGGLVGPSRIGFGTVIAAGVIYRGDCPEGHKLLMGKEPQREDKAFYPGLYWNVKRKVINSVEYIANIIALRQWYLTIRSKFYEGSEMEKLLYEGALEKLEMIFNERVKRFKALANKMEKSITLYRSIMGNKASEKLLNQKNQLFTNIQEIEKAFNQCQLYAGDEKKKVEFIKNIDIIIEKIGYDYIKVIKNLDEVNISLGTDWILSIIENTRNTIMKFLPAFN
ncbi:MAG: UDP-N-acetylglucosamine pyrophosphorylase [Promethearchaeota archaeon]|nr:MAG: UDP-N-acetylglucosamine pyrophosphorylase [Candidatus Lokiarchaeota archaeon]